MIPLDLSPDEQAAYHRALRAPYREIRIRARFETLDHQYVADVSSRVVDGSVTVDVDAEVTWSLSLTLLDPDFRLGLDSADPVDGQAFRDRMVRVWYGVWVEEIDRWVDAPVFTGPITKPDRDGDTIVLECQSKERLGMSPGWKIRVLAKGLTRVGAIEVILRELAGETRFRLPRHLKARLREALSLPKQATPWVHAKKLAWSMGMYLYYDAAGRATLRRYPTQATWWFDDAVVTSTTKVSHDALEDINTVVVTGAVPAKAKKPLTAEDSIPAWHPRSPSRMGRGGRGRYLVENIEDDTLKKQSDVDKTAARRVSEVMADQASMEFECAPIPHLEPMELCRRSGDPSLSFRMRRWNLPLNTGLMSVGTTRPARTSTARIRRRRRKGART